MLARIQRALNYRFQILHRKFLGEIAWIEREFSKGHLDYNTYYDRLTREILSRVLQPDSFCIDVGCFQGEILEQMMQFAPKGEFLAFEPLPEHYAGLVKHFPQPQVHLHNLALSRERGELSFNYVITNPGYSGLQKRRYDGQERDMEITVKTDLLDNILVQYPQKHVDFLKIDVEGAEFLVMQGAKAMIRRDRPYIIFEHGQGAADYYQTTPDQIYTLLCEECGLHISILPDYLRHNKPLQKEQFCDHYYTGEHFYFIAYPEDDS